MSLLWFYHLQAQISVNSQVMVWTLSRELIIKKRYILHLAVQTVLVIDCIPSVPSQRANSGDERKICT